MEERQDLISRQAAIDAIDSIQMSKEDTWYQFYQRVLTQLNKLPSADPEIILCKDCCHYPGEYSDCPMVGWFRHEDDYCSRAERRGEQDEEEESNNE